jgi:hypothetical protein
VPRLIKFSGGAQDEAHKPVTGVVGITFSLYQDQQGGPLWVETQNVQADAAGHYPALLAVRTACALSLFSSAEAHWISTQISGQRESTRGLGVGGSAFLAGCRSGRVTQIDAVSSKLSS